MWVWWRHLQFFPHNAFKVRVLVRLLCGQSCLGESKSRYCNSSPICQMCDRNVIESTIHFLFECVAFQDTRQLLWNNVIRYAPNAMCLELENMNSKKKCVFIMTGLHGSYIREWSDLYEAILNFCFKMYQQRRELEN